jgi:hypothetical protein
MDGMSISNIGLEHQTEISMIMLVTRLALQSGFHQISAKSHPHSILNALKELFPVDFRVWRNIGLVSRPQTPKVPIVQLTHRRSTGHLSTTSQRAGTLSLRTPPAKAAGPAPISAGEESGLPLICQ